MATVMTATEFVKKARDIAENYKTIYVLGGVGSPMTAKNKDRYTKNNSFNKKANRTKVIKAASEDTFGFDCSGLIKGLLWGWKGKKNQTYGGATFGSNGVPDQNANTLIRKCKDVSTNFNKLVPGEVVWIEGHIGIYLGDGLVAESTYRWEDGVQITACNCRKTGYKTRNWSKHGKLPYIEYDAKDSTTSKPNKPVTVKVDPAQEKSSTLAGTYKVTSAGLHIRSGAGSKKTSLGILEKDDEVKCYGFYSLADNGSRWLYVKTEDGSVGFCSSKYLKKC